MGCGSSSGRVASMDSSGDDSDSEDEVAKGTVLEKPAFQERVFNPNPNLDWQRKGSITTEQLQKGIRELKSPTRSRQVSALERRAVGGAVLPPIPRRRDSITVQELEEQRAKLRRDQSRRTLRTGQSSRNLSAMPTGKSSRNLSVQSQDLISAKEKLKRATAKIKQRSKRRSVHGVSDAMLVKRRSNLNHVDEVGEEEKEEEVEPIAEENNDEESGEDEIAEEWAAEAEEQKVVVGRGLTMGSRTARLKESSRVPVTPRTREPSESSPRKASGVARSSTQRTGKSSSRSYNPETRRTRQASITSDDLQDQIARLAMTRQKSFREKKRSRQASGSRSQKSQEPEDENVEDYHRELAKEMDFFNVQLCHSELINLNTDELYKLWAFYNASGTGVLSSTELYVFAEDCQNRIVTLYKQFLRVENPKYSDAKLDKIMEKERRWLLPCASKGDITMQLANAILGVMDPTRQGITEKMFIAKYMPMARTLFPLNETNQLSCVIS